VNFKKSSAVVNCYLCVMKAVRGTHSLEVPVTHGGECLVSCEVCVRFITHYCWGLSAGYQPRPQVVDRGTTARYGGQLRYI